MRLDQKGFAVPLMLIVVLLILAVPAYYIISSLPTSSSDIRGASSEGNINDRPGFSVSITSTSSTWDLVEYLCGSLDECTTSLTSGRRWGTVSGGQTDLHDVVVEYSDEWSNYEYIKYFVRSGWYAQGKDFNVVSAGNVPNSDVFKVSDGNESYDVVVAPVSVLSNGFYSSAHFSDL